MSLNSETIQKESMSTPITEVKQEHHDDSASMSEQEESSSISDIIVLNTTTHTMTNNKGQVQFTLFEKDSIKMVRIETDKSMIVPVEMLTDYLLKQDSITSNTLARIDDVKSMATMFSFVYFLTVIGACIWTYSILHGIHKIEHS